MRDDWGSPDEERRQVSALQGARLRYAAARAERDMRLRDVERIREQYWTIERALREAEVAVIEATKELGRALEARKELEQ